MDTLRRRLEFRIATLMSLSQPTESLKNFVYDRIADQLTLESDDGLIALLDDFLVANNQDLDGDDVNE